MDLLEKWAEFIAKCEEPQNASIEEVYAYWGIRMAKSLAEMFGDEMPEVDKLEKFNELLRDFVPKIEKILKGE